MAKEDDDEVRPVNVSDAATPEETGFLIVRVKKEAAQQLVSFLQTRGLELVPLITSVKPDVLDELEQKARKAPPAWWLTSYSRIDVRKLPVALTKEIESLLGKLPGVEVYREKAASDPVGTSNTLDPLQRYLGPAPDGIDARWAWQQTNGDGTGMRFVDLEQAWLPGHPDLPPGALPPICHENNSDVVKRQHGAAVLGIVAGLDNTTGVIGIAPNLLSVQTASWFRSSDSGVHVACALSKILATTPLPDVVLIEVQVAGSGLPIETEPAVAQAIQNLTAAGVIVVEAAGNGALDLDNWPDAQGNHPLNRDPASAFFDKFVDTGAIMVAAARAHTTTSNQHVRNSISNFGSRIDCYGWGDSIVTAGYGDLAGNGTPEPYTRGFGGTSGASPMIAGAALLVQSILIGAAKPKLTPDEMRTALADTTTGTPQDSAKPGHIGVMPDLRSVVQKLVPGST